MANDRIWYAVQQVGMKALNGDSYTAAHGVQSFGMTTNFNLDQVFELGQQEIYENIEEIPDVEITMSKVLDGYPLLYHLATKGAATTAPTLAGRQNTKTFVAAAIFPDTNTSCDGVADSIVECSGMRIGSVGYNFPVDGNFSEDVTLVGNDKIWKGDSNILHTATQTRRNAISFDGAFGSEDSPLAPNVGVNRRQDLIFGAGNGEADTNGSLDDPDVTVLPQEVYGITSSGTNEKTNDVYGAHVSNISVSVDFGREQINELGRRAPYHRFVNFPVEVTTEIEVVSSSGDMVSATEDGILTVGAGGCLDAGNLSHRTIRIAVCEGTRIYLGRKNKLSSVNYGGGDAGGGSVSVSYTYTTYSDFTVMHSGDPHANGSTWWANRETNTYLVED